MGSGIAQVSASAGNNVHVVDLSEDVLTKSRKSIETGLSRVGKKQFSGDAGKINEFVSNTVGRIKFTSDLVPAVRDSDLVIEAIVEKLEAKQQLFKSIDDKAPEKTIFATNTSSLKCTKIAEVLSRKDRFAGIHFFNPVAVMKLVEIVSTADTSKSTHDAVFDWTKGIGKVPVDCKDTPGFIVNQLLVPNLVQAMLMTERGDASPRDIDTAMKLGAGHPMGPFELADYVGLDVISFILEGWQKEYPNEPRYVIPETLKKLVKQNKLGVKTGAGFYEYKK